jgi:hypothetical protein
MYPIIQRVREAGVALHRGILLEAVGQRRVEYRWECVRLPLLTPYQIHGHCSSFSFLEKLS